MICSQSYSVRYAACDRRLRELPGTVCQRAQRALKLGRLDLLKVAGLLDNLILDAFAGPACVLNLARELLDPELKLLELVPAQLFVFHTPDLLDLGAEEATRATFTPLLALPRPGSLVILLLPSDSPPSHPALYPALYLSTSPLPIRLSSSCPTALSARGLNGINTV